MFHKINFNKKISVLTAAILVILFFVLGLLLGGNKYLQKDHFVIKGADTPVATSTAGVMGKNSQLPAYLNKDVDFGLFWDVWKLVKEKYYETDIPETQLFYGAVSGIVSSLGDPYSLFMTPVGTEEFQDDLKGKFEGIGAEIGIRHNILTVISPLPDTPAMRAGLQPKDLILKIDGVETKDMSLSQAVNKIRGKDGTKVTLTILRKGDTDYREVVIVRAPINVKSLTWDWLDNDIIHIKVRQFNDDTIPLLNQAIVEILAKNTRGIILDLRHNPGGYLHTAIEMASEWVDGKLVVSEKTRGGGEKKHQANKKSRLDGYKTVVLVNGGSASASEIVAGALKDWQEATIVGEKTFGKGSVQDLTTLKDGSSVKLTIAKWFTPNGTSIEDEGIMPDIKVELTEDDYNNFSDPQLDKAVEILNNPSLGIK